MTKPWNEVAASEGFKALPPDQQDGARRQYFDDVVAPRVPPEHVEIAWDQFATDTGVGKRALPEGVKPSLAGAGRGSTIPTAPSNRPISLADARPSIPVAPVDMPPSDPMGSGFAETMAVSQPKRESVLEGVQMQPPVFNADEANRLSTRSYAETTPSINDPRLTAPSLRQSAGIPRSTQATERGQFFEDTPIPVRAAAKAVAGIAQGTGGAVRAIGDVTGIDSLSRAGQETAKGADEFQKGMGDIKQIEGFGPKSPAPYLANMAEGATSSLAQSAAFASAFGAGAVIPLMSIQSAGQEYDQARNAGLDPASALAGALPKGIFEAVGEKFTGLDRVAGAMGTLLNKGASTQAKRTAGDVLVRAGIREVPGEIITYLGQTGVDLLPGIGLNQNLTMGQFIDGLRDTVVQSAMMGGAMGATGRAVSSEPAAPTPTAEQMARDRGFLSYKPDTLRPTERHKEIISSVDDIAVAQGIPPKAVAAAKDKADTLPLAERPGFFKRFFGAYGRGRGIPLDDAALGPLDAHDAALHQPEDLPPVNDVLALEQGNTSVSNRDIQNLPEATANIDAPATETIAPEWQAFPPESGTLGVPRAEMPQIQSVHRGALVNYLKARGVEAVQGEIQADQLKPTQAEFSPAKVERAKNFEGDDRSILISSDGHILDGHHQWLAKLDGNQTVKAIQLNAPISELVPLVNSFPSSYQDEASQAPADQAAPVDASPAEAGQSPEVQPAASGVPDEVGAAQPSNDALISRGEVASPLEDRSAPNADLGHLGKNNTPLSEGGKPFRTNKAAREAKKQQPMMRVVKVEGGYALAPKTEKQLAAQTAAARRLAVPRMGQPGVPLAAHEFIAGEGGIDPSHKGEFSMGNNPRVGNRRLFAGARGGLSLEDATQKLIEAGYLQEGASHSDAINLIGRSITQPQYTPDGVEQMAQAEQDQQFEDHLAAQQEAAQNDDFDPFESLDELGFDPADIEGSGYDEAADPIKLEVNALLAHAEALGIDTDTIKEQAYEDTRNGSEQDYLEATRDALQAAIQGSNGNSGQDSGSQSDAGKQNPNDGGAIQSPGEAVEPAPARKLEAGQAEIDEAKGLKYKTPDLVQVLGEELDPTDAFDMHRLAYTLPKARDYNRIMTAHNGDITGIEFKKPAEPKYPNIPIKYAFVLPDASESGKWRVSYFDKDGFSRHESEATREAVQVTLITDGFTIEDRGALDRLAGTRDWARGTAFADLILKLNKSQITLAEFNAEQIKLNDDFEAESKGEINHNGTRIYPVKMAGRDGAPPSEKWAVESSENKARRESGERNRGGDTLHSTIDEAKKAAEFEAKQDQQKKARLEEIAAREQAEKDAADAKKEANKGKTLTEIKAQGYMAQTIKDGESGEELTRAEWVKKLVDGGAKPSIEMVNKIKPMSRTAFNRATNQEQAAHEKKIRDGGKVPEYSIGNYIVSKTEYDFAQSLNAEGPNQSSGFTTELSPSGTLRIKGDQTAIRAKLKAGGVTRMTPMTGGVVVGKTEAAQAQAIMNGADNVARKPDSAQDSSAQNNQEAIKLPDAQDSQQLVRNEALIELRKRMSVLNALKACLSA